MEAPTKRRKLDHASSESARATAPNFESATSAGIFRPSTFILETEELLHQSRLNYDRFFTGSGELLHKLKSAIESIETHEPIPIAEASSKFEASSDIKIPYPNPRPDSSSPYKLSVEKPVQCNVVGSYVSKTMVKSQKSHKIDMVVEMPRPMFQEKDYLNLRYFYKRAYYLANIALAVRAAFDGSISLVYEFLNDNPLLPVLDIAIEHPAGHGGNGTSAATLKSRSSGVYQIRVIPCVSDGLFPKQKLIASSNNLRLEKKDQDEKKEPSPTPFYNSTLKAETTFLAYLRVLHQAQKNCPAFTDACMLGRIWLQQRGFGGSISSGGFGNFEWAVLVALLMHTSGKKGASALSSSLSSTQIFKAVVQFLAGTGFRNKPFVLGPPLEGNADSIRETGPVLFDAVRQLNIGFKMSSWSAMMLRQYAKWTHDLLSDGLVDDQFGATFIARADIPLQTFDLLVRIQCPESDDGSTAVDRRGFIWDFGDSVFQVLKRAYGDRVELVHIQLPDRPTWGLADALPSLQAPAILVGVVLNQANMSRQVDHGPPAEEKKEAKKFRQFWGERAELRRFKDGQILETLIWTQSSPFALCEEITRYILGRHLHLDHDDLEFLGGDFASLVPIKTSDGAAYNRAREAFQVLEKDIRSLEDLPLHVRQLAPIAPELRSSSVRPPALGSPKAALHPMEVVLYFEASGKWPDNLAAIQRTKMAFLLKIGQSLEHNKSGVSAHLGLEDAQSDIENIAFLDIVYEEEASFRLRIHSDLEESLLERRTKDKTLDQHVRTDSARLLATFKRLYTHLPLQNQTISTFCTRFPSLSATIRLTKRWFDAHKLSCHFTDELIEILVLRAFVHPHPWQTPSSAMTGFLRTLLFLSRWDWRIDPLIVDTSGELSPADRSSVVTRLEAWRKIDPNMNHTVLCVATSHDASGTAFTTRGGHPAPSKVVATRMTTLARSACKLVKDEGVDLDPKALFQPSLREYNILIQLSARAVKAVLRGDDSGGTKHSVFKNLDERTARPLLPVPRHPARVYLDQLNALYGAGGPVVFFHGAPDDTLIAGIWNPLLQRRSFRVNLPCSFKPATGDDDGEAQDEEDGGNHDLMEVNRQGIVAEIARIGADLVERIDVAGEESQ